MWDAQDNTAISGTERNYILKKKKNAESTNCTVFTLNSILLKLIKEREKGWTWSTQGVREKRVYNFTWKI